MKQTHYIFLKPNISILVAGVTLTDKFCIITEQPLDLVRDAIGDAIEQAISKRDFYAQQHAHRFERYTYLPTIASAKCVEIFETALTPAEQRIYDLIVLGYKQQEIADKIFLSLGTIKFHMHSIMKKSGVNSTPEIIAQHYLGKEKFASLRSAA